MPSSSASVARIAEANMKKWLEREKISEKMESASSHEILGPYVSISRQCGSGGEEIAEALAGKLGWDLIDRNILQTIADDFDVSTELVDHVDEKHVAWLTEVFEAWLEKKKFNQESYLHDLSRLLLIAAQHGKFVVVGRGSQHILPRKFGFFVRLVAPHDVRVANVARTKNLSESEAAQVVNQTDKERGEFLRTYFHSDGTDPAEYDLVINTASFEQQAICELIKQAMTARLGGVME